LDTPEALKYAFTHSTAVRYVVAITGCSGIGYGLRLLEVLEGEKVLVISKTAENMLGTETGVSMEELSLMADRIHRDDDLFAPIASGSCKFDGMIVVPCSASTLAKIASGIGDTLITRVATVCLKEGRRLILVPRETPVDAIMLENQLRLVNAGATVLPASPGFYHSPQSIEDLVDFIVGRILDQLGLENDMFQRWNGER